MKNIWHNLKKPIFVLAPMDEVTDTVFRQIVAEVAKPDIFYTEFTNVDGLQSAGREKVIKRFQFSKKEKPLIAQVWGLNPDNFFKTSKEIKKMGFDGIDLNMGCPDHSTIKKGACSALINNPTLAKEIILATQRGAGGLPVSVKTRIGFNKIITQEWIRFLLGLNLDALVVHGRTVKEMSNVSAHWDEIAKAVKIRDKCKVKTLIIGNGDVLDKEDGLKKVKEYGVDGVMIGRGILKNIFAFDNHPNQIRSSDFMLDLLVKHASLFDQTWKNLKNFAILRKFFKIYVSTIPGASDLRLKLMETKNLEQVKVVIDQFNKIN